MLHESPSAGDACEPGSRRILLRARPAWHANAHTTTALIRLGGTSHHHIRHPNLGLWIPSRMVGLGGPIANGRGIPVSTRHPRRRRRHPVVHPPPRVAPPPPAP